MEVDEDGEEDDSDKYGDIEIDYSPERTHDIWDESNEIDENTLREFTEKFINSSQKGKVPAYLESMISSLKNSKG